MSILSWTPSLHAEGLAAFRDQPVAKLQQFGINRAKAACHPLQPSPRILDAEAGDNLGLMNIQTADDL